jgi:hypothetical protein
MQEAIQMLRICLGLLCVIEIPFSGPSPLVDVGCEMERAIWRSVTAFSSRKLFGGSFDLFYTRVSKFDIDMLRPTFWDLNPSSLSGMS